MDAPGKFNYRFSPRMPGDYPRPGLQEHQVLQEPQGYHRGKNPAHPVPRDLLGNAQLAENPGRKGGMPRP